MKQIAVIAILIIAIGIIKSNCQDKLSYDFLMSPNYCYRELIATDHTKEFIVNSRNNNEKTKFSYKIGFGANYNFEKSFISLDLLLANKGYQSELNSSNIITPDPIHPLYGSIYSSASNSTFISPDKINIIYNYYYLDVPISYSYIFLDRKIRLYVTGGFQGSFLLLAQRKSISTFNDGNKEVETNDDKADYESVNFSLIGGFGVDFQAKNKFHIVIEPYYERNITTNIVAPIKQYLYSVGLNIKLRYK